MTVDTDFLDAFLDGYIACALWSSTDNSDPDTGGDPFDDNYDASDIHPLTRTAMHDDCADFIVGAGDLLRDADPSQAGHDFWLTRNHHGAGFWDRSKETYPRDPQGKRLTELAHAYGSVDLYVGDDELIHA
jgi:hypothetical protein